MMTVNVVVRALCLVVGVVVGWVVADYVAKIVGRLDRLEARACKCSDREPRLGDPGRPDLVR